MSGDREDDGADGDQTSGGDQTGGGDHTSGAPAGRYRLDDATMRRLNRIVFGVLLGALVLAALVALTGLVIFLAGGRDDAVLDGVSGPMYAVAAMIALAGVAGSLAMAAYFGGESLRRGGGPVGIGLFLGIMAIAVGAASGWHWLLWIGFPLTGLAVIGFFVLGSAAGVPMWVQAPGGPRVYVRRGTRATPPGDTRSFRLHGQAGDVDVRVTGITDTRRPGHGRHESADGG